MTVFFLKLMQQSCINMFQLLLLLLLKPELRWKQIARAAQFFFNQQKNKFARAARFLSFFAVVLHNYNAVL